MNKVSVIIPVYNAEAFLHETIDSVLCQTFSDFELLLLDDGSTDSSSDIIRSYADDRIKYVPCTHDFIGTLNRGFPIATGKYIAQLDHDDLMIPQRLQIQYDFMEEHPEIAACGGYMHTFGKYFTEIRLPLEHNQLVVDMLLHGPILNPTGFIRRKILTEHSIRHQRGYSYSADYKFWSEIVKIGKIANIPKILTLYRTSDNQTSIKYYAECMEGAGEIQWEMLNYFLSHLKDENEPAETVTEKFLPAIEDLNRFAFFSNRVFFLFMHELIQGLWKEGAIDL
jgi:glycosyltransferase involved in cell wall biosynthesis